MHVQKYPRECKWLKKRKKSYKVAILIRLGGGSTVNPLIDFTVENLELNLDSHIGMQSVC